MHWAAVWSRLSNGRYENRDSNQDSSQDIDGIFERDGVGYTQGSEQTETMANHSLHLQPAIYPCFCPRVLRGKEHVMQQYEIFNRIFAKNLRIKRFHPKKPAHSVAMIKMHPQNDDALIDFLIQSNYSSVLSAET